MGVGPDKESDFDRFSRNSEASYHITTDENPEGYWVCISAVGGGTPGRLYSEQKWHFAVFSDRGSNLEDCTLYIPRSSSHYQAAVEGLVFFEDYQD